MQNNVFTRNAALDHFELTGIQLPYVGSYYCGSQVVLARVAGLHSDLFTIERYSHEASEHGPEVTEWRLVRYSWRDGSLKVLCEVQKSLVSAIAAFKAFVGHEGDETDAAYAGLNSEQESSF